MSFVRLNHYCNPALLPARPQQHYVAKPAGYSQDKLILKQKKSRILHIFPVWPMYGKIQYRALDLSTGPLITKQNKNIQALHNKQNITSTATLTRFNKLV